jgi:hypothetical protein
MDMSDLNATQISMPATSTSMALKLSVSNYAWGTMYKGVANCSANETIIGVCPTMERYWHFSKIFCN